MFEVRELVYGGDVKQYIADCISVVRGKDPKDNDKLFDRLLTESVGGKASRVLEFLPCKVDWDTARELGNGQDNIFLIGTFLEDGYYTNARELLNLGMPLDAVLDMVDFTNYKVFRITTPYFIYGQVSTHTQLTTVSHSQRYAESDKGYWKPLEVDVPQITWNEIVENNSPKALKKFMKEHGVVRKEVFDRGSDMLQYREFTIGGYTHLNTQWEHFIAQRTDSHTQLETRQLAERLKEMLW